MFGSQFYNQSIRKYVVMFGNMFNDIVVQRLNNSGTVIQSIAVPIAYGPKEKFLVRISQDPNLDREVALQLPRMGFEMTSLTYDPIRKLNSVGKIMGRALPTEGQGTLRKMFNPVPYNMDFQLFVFVDNAEDGTQILEQILPFFTPDFNVTINAVSELGIKLDVPISFNSASLEDTFDGEFTARRTLIWTLDFFMKGFLYPDIKGGGKIVKSVQVDFHEFDGLGDNIPDLDRMRLESSTISASDFLSLEDGDEFILETGGVQGDSISRISITPVGGKDVDVDPKVDFDANTTVTIFNPAVDSDPETGIDS